MSLQMAALRSALICMRRSSSTRQSVIRPGETSSTLRLALCTPLNALWPGKATLHNRLLSLIHCFMSALGKVTQSKENAESWTI